MSYRRSLPMFAVSMVCLVLPGFAENAKSDPGSQTPSVSPNQHKVNKEKILNKNVPQGGQCPGTGLFPEEFRTIDGTYNNCLNPEWGSAHIPMLRLTAIDYEDGKDSPSGANRANPRAISNTVAHQGNNDYSYQKVPRYSDWIWQWGQFLDHDLDLTPVADPAERFDVTVPSPDKHFDPDGTGGVIIPLERSLYSVVNGVRQQINEITAYIDASTVYGSDKVRAETLREMDGTGRMKITSPGDLLPFNTFGLPNAAPVGAHADEFFLAGDFRANEQVGLTALHTLFVREHNYWADYFRKKHPKLNDEQLYQRARAIVGAELQHITYHEFLPLLLGKKALSRYRGYQPNVNAGISNIFATAAYRFGHSMVSSKFLLLNSYGESIGYLPLRKAFFNTKPILKQGLEPILRGLASHVVQRCDIYMVNALRNALFRNTGQVALDLASLNLQRGRDHGLPDYNQVRKDFGLSPVKNFSQISSDPKVRKRLRAAYNNVNDMDVWMVGLAEDAVHGAMVGETVRAVLIDQFERVRDGDRFWYEIYLPRDLLGIVRKQTLAEIIQRNTQIGKGIRNNVFLVY